MLSCLLARILFARATKVPRPPVCLPLNYDYKPICDCYVYLTYMLITIIPLSCPNSPITTGDEGPVASSKTQGLGSSASHTTPLPITHSFPYMKIFCGWPMGCACYWIMCLEYPPIFSGCCYNYQLWSVKSSLLQSTFSLPCLLRENQLLTHRWILKGWMPNNILSIIQVIPWRGRQWEWYCGSASNHNKGQSLLFLEPKHTMNS